MMAERLLRLFQPKPLLCLSDGSEYTSLVLAAAGLVLNRKHTQGSIDGISWRNSSASGIYREWRMGREFTNLLGSHGEPCNLTEVEYLKKLPTERRIGRESLAIRCCFGVRQYAPCANSDQTMR